MQPDEFDERRASARLPHLDIDVVHRRARDGEAEQISISLQAVPSFRAVGAFLEAVYPFQLWAEVARLTWMPWLEAFRGASLHTAATTGPRLSERLPTSDNSREPSSGRSTTVQARSNSG
jgi:hypothetical protein